MGGRGSGGKACLRVNGLSAWGIPGVFLGLPAGRPRGGWPGRHVSELVSWGCCDKGHRPGSLNDRKLSSCSLEAESPDRGVCLAGSPGGSERKSSLASGAAAGGRQQPWAPARRCTSRVSAFYSTRPSPCVSLCVPVYQQSLLLRSLSYWVKAHPTPR